MYRFLLRPAWLAFHLGVLLLVVLMVNLALWQVRRLEEKRDFNAEVRAHSSAPVQPVEALLPPGADVEPADLQWYNVSATGTYLADEQVLVVNVSQGGSPGVDPVVPLRLDDGRLLLVNRGFVASGVDVPPPPSGEVTIVGRLRPTQTRATGALSDPAAISRFPLCRELASWDGNRSKRTRCRRNWSVQAACTNGEVRNHRCT